MQIERLDHVNLRTSRLDEMIAWYGDILDMHPGDRPGFAFRGAWVYAGGQPLVHLVEVADDPQNDKLKLEHFALSANGLPAFLERLEKHGVAHTLDPVPGFPIVQVNLHDPDGNHIHVDFDVAEAEGLI